MESSLGGWLRVFVAGSCVLAAGCGESFTATGGGTTTSTGGTGGAGATGGTAGGGGSTTTSAECTQGQTQLCYTGPTGTKGKGICKAGVNKCVNGQWSDTCVGQVTPEPTETCDGKDNTCNGATDEGCACTDGKTQDCTSGSGTPGVGICKGGTQTCSGGAWGTCNGAVGAGVEACNNIGDDDDCDGILDNVPNAGTDCSTGGTGVCSAGTLKCVGDAAADLTCVQDVEPSAEACNNQGADNNCDGILDNVPNLGQACSINIPAGGTCTGTTKCTMNGGSFCGPSVYFADDFSNPQGWKAEGEWSFGNTTGSFGQTAGNGDPISDHTGTNDNKLAGIVVGGNASVDQHEPYYLTSKVLDTNKSGPVFLSYFRWLNAEVSAQMIETLEVSANGQSWTTIWSNGSATIFDNAWVLQSFDISQFKSPTFQFRFGHEVPVDGGATVSSWNVDDVAIASCPILP